MEKGQFPRTTKEIGDVCTQATELAELECFHFLLTSLAYDSVAYDLVKTRMSELKAEVEG